MKGRVLIVDDELSMAELLQASLIQEGLEATALTSAEVAFENVSQGLHDVVVTDVRMRGLSGLQLCDRIVQNFPHVPVIVMTAFGSMDTAIEAIRAGAYDLLVKARRSL